MGFGYEVDPTPCLNQPWWPFNPYLIVNVDKKLWANYSTPYAWDLCIVPPLYWFESFARGPPASYLLQRLPATLLGMTLNSFVLYFSFISSCVDKNFKYFLGNLAICDFFFSFFVLWDGVIHFLFQSLRMPTNIDMCSIQRQPHMILSYCVFYATPLVSFNRYATVVLEKAAFFTKRNVLLICLTSYIPLIVYVIAHMAPYITLAVVDNYCGFVLYPTYLREVLAAPIAFAFLLLVYCNFQLYRRLQGHFSEVTVRIRKTEQEIKEERSLLWAAVLQAALPMICGLPVIIKLVIDKVVDYICMLDYVRTGSTHWQRYQECGQGGGTGSLGYITDQLFYFLPTVDALLTLLVIKPYRNAVKGWYAKYRSQSFTESDMRPSIEPRSGTVVRVRAFPPSI